MTPTHRRTHVRVIGSGEEAERHLRAWAAIGHPVLVEREDGGDRSLVRGSLDAVSVCVDGPARRFALARRFLEAGAHVLSRAPVAPDPAGAAELAVIAEATDRILVPAHPVLYTAGLQRLMALVYDGRLGPVQNVYSFAQGPIEAWACFEPTGADAGAALTAHAAVVKTLCVLPEARTRGQAPEETAEGPRFAATMFYGDEILATVRLDPAARPARRGVMVTFAGGVLRWEVDDGGDRLTLRRGPHERALPLGRGNERPYDAMVRRFLRAVLSDVPPYEDAEAARRAVALERAWQELPPARR